MARQGDPALIYDAEAARMRRHDKEVIPTRLVIAMFSLALLTLAITAFAVLTGREPTGRAAPATALERFTLTIEGDGDAVRVTDASGRVLLDAERGGFVAVVNDGLERARVVHRVDGNPPVELTQWDDGRLTLIDPASGWKTELASFGPGNFRVWRDMLDQ